MAVFRPLPRAKAAFIRQIILKVFEVGQHLPLALLEFVLDQAVPRDAGHSWKTDRAKEEGPREMKGPQT